jgi:type IV secretory pathway VirB2 component (pilin)
MPISEFAQVVIRYLMSFISIIAVIYIIYAGFSVMIGGGDEEKVKKAKNIILYVVVGILIMWLAYGIVKFTLNIVSP